MSTMILNAECINRAVSAVFGKCNNQNIHFDAMDNDTPLADSIYAAIYWANHKEYKANYPNETGDFPPLRRNKWLPASYSEFELLKAIECVLYNSELDDNTETTLRDTANGIRAAIVRILPAYGDAPWNPTDDAPRAPKVAYRGRPGLESPQEASPAPPSDILPAEKLQNVENSFDIDDHPF